MAVYKGRNSSDGHKRNSWWFLLKDSVIFVLIMCMLQVLHVHLIPKIMAETTVTTTLINDSNSNNNSNSNSAIVVNSMTNNSNNNNKFIIKTKDNAVQTKKPAINKSNVQPQQQPIVYFKKNNLSVSSKNNSENLIANKWNLPRAFNKRTQISADNKSALLRFNNSSLELTEQNINSNILGHVSSSQFIRENVVLPTSDSEREAQLLYEQTLKDYHVDTHTQSQADNNATSTMGISANNTHAVDQNSLQSICNFWTQKYCQCMGTLERLSLNCRAIGILAVPIDLPNNIVQL